MQSIRGFATLLLVFSIGLISFIALPLRHVVAED